MAYRVIKDFHDRRTITNRAYKVGDPYPHPDKIWGVSQKWIDYLLNILPGQPNRAKEPYIEWVPDEKGETENVSKVDQETAAPTVAPSESGLVAPVLLDPVSAVPDLLVANSAVPESTETPTAAPRRGRPPKTE